MASWKRRAGKDNVMTDEEVDLLKRVAKHLQSESFETNSEFLGKCSRAVFNAVSFIEARQGVEDKTAGVEDTEAGAL